MRISDWSSDVCSSDLSAVENEEGVRPKKQTQGEELRMDKIEPVSRSIGCLPLSGCQTIAVPSSLPLTSTSPASPFPARSEARRGGTEWFSTCRSRLSPYP